MAAFGSVGVEVAAGCCAGVVDAAVFVAADWDSAGDATRDKIAAKEMILLNMSNSPLRGTLGNQRDFPRGRSPEKPLHANSGIMRAIAQKSIIKELQAAC
jgi:hypothetical protein